MLFSQIIGQEKVKRQLVQTVVDQRVSHAQLFLGPEGSGKLALAIAYAQFINCKNRQVPENLAEADSCGSCPSCIKYQKLAHPDLHFIYPVAATPQVKKPVSKAFLTQWREGLIEHDYRMSLNDWFKAIEIEKKQGIINAEDCNEIIKTLSYKSYESEFKVMIIWMVEKLFHSAAPKILKILEEPPDKTLFLLVSESQDQIINTILSRTQIVKINRISDSALKNALIEKYSCPEGEADRIVSLAEGNYIEAVKILERGDDELPLFISYRDWMRLCYQNKVQDIHAFVTEMAKLGREHQKMFLTYSSRMIRSAMMVNYHNQDAVSLSAEEREFLAKFSPFINAANILSMADAVDKAQYHIERNANPGITFMDLSLNMTVLLHTK